MSLDLSSTLSSIWESFNGFNPYKIFDVGKKDQSKKRVNLHIEITSQRIYQKETVLTEGATPIPQFLSGMLFVRVMYPTKIGDISVALIGMKNETVLGNSAIKERTKMRFKKIIVDDKFLWKSQYKSETPVGVYIYPFNFVINSTLPETMNTYYMKVAYKVQASLNTCGADSRSHRLTKEEPIYLIKSLSDTYLLNMSPIIASGNWRDILIYVFNIQSKVAFEGQPFTTSVFIYPIDLSLQTFKIHSVSVILIQRLEFDVLDCDKTSKRHSEVQKVLLYRKFPKEGDIAIENGCYKFDTTALFPSSEAFNRSTISPNGRNGLHKLIHPSTNNDCEIGFSSNHILKICFEVNEMKRAINHNPQVKKSGNITQAKGLRKSTLDDNVAPSYAAYHKQKNDSSRYKRVELSFSSPIELLCADSYDTDSLPLYSSFVTAQENINVRHDRTRIGRVYPPDYDKITSL